MFHPKTFENSKRGDYVLTWDCKYPWLSVLTKLGKSRNQVAPSMDHYVKQSDPKSEDRIEWSSINQMSIATHMAWFNRPNILIWKST